MGLLVGLPWILTLGIGFIVGCGDVLERPETAPLSLAIRLFEEPLEGVQLCQTDTENCAVSDDNGNVGLIPNITAEPS